MNISQTGKHGFLDDTVHFLEIVASTEALGKDSVTIEPINPFPSSELMASMSRSVLEGKENIFIKQ